MTAVDHASPPTAHPFRAKVALAAWPRAWRAEYRERIVTDLAGTGYRWGAVADSVWRGTVRRLTQPRPPGAEPRQWPALARGGLAFVVVMAVQTGLTAFSIWAMRGEVTDQDEIPWWDGVYLGWYTVAEWAGWISWGSGPVLGVLALLVVSVRRLRATAVGVGLAAPLAFLLDLTAWSMLAPWVFAGL